MADKSEDRSKEKIAKLSRVLKELEEKYKKVMKDRTALLTLLKSALPTTAETAAQFEASAGQVDSDKLASILKQLDADKAKSAGEELEAARKKAQALADENAVLKAAERPLKLKIGECVEKIDKLETELQRQAKQQVTPEANALLAKLKSVGHPSPPVVPDPSKELEAKMRDQLDLINTLKAQVAELQQKKETHNGQPTGKSVVTDAEAQTQSATTEKDPIRLALELDTLRAELNLAQRRISELQFEYNTSKKKAQTILTEKDGEIARLKETARLVRAHAKSPPHADSAVSGKLNVTASSSGASLGGDDKAVIIQLEQRVAELSEVINMHSQSEQETAKKLRHYEMTRSSGDINYEYIKNIFLKYLAFANNGVVVEAKRLETLMLDLLHVNMEEKASLQKATTSKSYFWGLFSAPKEAGLANLNASYVAPNKFLHRAQTESMFEGRRDGDMSMDMGKLASLEMVSHSAAKALTKKK